MARIVVHNASQEEMYFIKIGECAIKKIDINIGSNVNAIERTYMTT